MGRSRRGYRKCRACKKEKKLDTNFYKKKANSGAVIYEYVCKKCKTQQFLQRYNKAKELIKELSAVEYPADYIQDQECGKCIFLVECNYMVKVKKSLVDPYCFEDSKFHHRYLKQYNKELT